MAERTCLIDGCGRRRAQREWCYMHYSRWRRWGSTEATARVFGDRIERLRGKFTVAESGCWRWNAGLVRGYGTVQWGGRTCKAHRVMYEIVVGPIPAGAQLDHTCHNADASCPGGPSCPHRSCVNPEHLEPVTHLENVQRSIRNHRQKNQTHCIHGHPLYGANLYVNPYTGRRVCRECRRAAHGRYRARRAS